MPSGIDQGREPGADLSALAELRMSYLQEAEPLGSVPVPATLKGMATTAATPCADLVGVEGMGLMQAITDARTTFAQSLHAILVAELADTAGWELLIELARSAGQDALAERFELPLQQEQEHLDQVRIWVSELMLAEARV